MGKPNDFETEAYLARIRRTIEESNRLVEQATLRIAETDRMLEQQGLTREQVMNFRFSDEQREMVNAELKRRGMEPLEEYPEYRQADGAPAAWLDAGVQVPAPEDAQELENRQKKFGFMMKPFQI